MTVNVRDEMRNSIKQRQIAPMALNRFQKFALRYEMLNDNFAPQVKRHLVNIYTKAADIRLDRQLDLTNNIFKTITQKVSRVYSFGVEREFSSEDTQELYKELQINKIMKEANLFTNALNDVLLQVSWNYKENKPRLIFRYPHKTKVELDEYDQPKEVEYFVEQDDKDREKWAYWSDSEHYYKIYDGEDITIEYPEGNEEGVNPYGVLPFVFMQNGFRDGNFFDEYTGEDLVYITLDNAVYNTFKNYLIKWQSFKQLVVTGANIGELSGQLLDPSTALTASGENVSVDLLDLTADLKQLDEVLQSSANNVAINYNISPSQFRMSGQVSSGFALQMENASLDEFTLEQQGDFVHYEKQLFDLLSIVVGIEENKDLGDMNIVFNKPRYAESKSVELDSTLKEVDLGIKKVSEVIAEKRQITIEEAEALLEENIKERNKVYKKVDAVNELNIDTTAQALGI